MGIYLVRHSYLHQPHVKSHQDYVDLGKVLTMNSMYDTSQALCQAYPLSLQSWYFDSIKVYMFAMVWGRINDMRVAVGIYRFGSLLHLITGREHPARMNSSCLQVCLYDLGNHLRCPSDDVRPNLVSDQGQTYGPRQVYTELLTRNMYSLHVLLSHVLQDAI